MKKHISYAVEIYPENSVGAGVGGKITERRGRGKIGWNWMEQSLLNIATFGEYFIVMY